MTKLYILATPAPWFGSEDHHGVLYDEEGETIHGHLSSSLEWLKMDLLSNFGRAKEFAAKYPDGFEVALITDVGPDYDELTALWDKNHPGWRDEVDDGD